MCKGEVRRAGKGSEAERQAEKEREGEEGKAWTVAIRGARRSATERGTK